VGAVNPLPYDGIDGVYLHGDQVSGTEVFPDVVAPQKRTVRDDSYRDAKIADAPNHLTEVSVKCRLTIGDEGEIIDTLILRQGRPNRPFHLVHELPDVIKSLPFHGHVRGTPKLAVDTGVVTGLWGKRINAEAAPKTARRHGAEHAIWHIRILCKRI
jgi:hypothetical protein